MNVSVRLASKERRKKLTEKIHMQNGSRIADAAISARSRVRSCVARAPTVVRLSKLEPR